MYAGLLHDCAKCVSSRDKFKLCKKYDIPISPSEERSPFLLHAKLGALFAQKYYETDDEDILHAIQVHTTGAPNMNTLDKIIYIADYMEARGVSHSDIETELDRALLEKDGKNPVLSDYTRHLRRDLDTEEAIASVLEVTPEQVDRSILGFRWMIRFFQCPHRGKERAAGFLCTVLGKHSFVKGLFMTGRENAACRDAREFLESRLEEAVDTAVKLILEYYRKIDGCQALSAGFERDFE